MLGSGSGAVLHGVLRARLGLSDEYALFPAEGPRQRLVEVWARLAPGRTVHTEDPVVAALAELWRARGAVGATNVLGDMYVGTCLKDPVTDAVIARVLGPPGTWTPLDPTVDVAVCAHLGAGPGAIAGPGFTVVRRTHPLCAALAEGTLFAAGPPETGGLDGAALAAAVAAATDRGNHPGRATPGGGGRRAQGISRRAARRVRVHTP